MGRAKDWRAAAEFARRILAASKRARQYDSLRPSTRLDTSAPMIDSVCLNVARFTAHEKALSGR